MENVFLNEDFLNSNKHYAKKSSWLAILFKILFYATMLFFVINIVFNLVFIKAQVVGISMIPTYNKNLEAEIVYDNTYYENSIYKDNVIANKFEKGKNNDIILLQLGNEFAIKRIIAVGGQKVSLKRGNGSSDFSNYYYYVNDLLLNEEYIYNRNHMDISYFNRFCFDNSENRNFNVNITTPNIEAEFVVPENTVFVLGDNRLVSGDSLRYGTINTNDIYGKVVLSYEYNQSLIGYIWQQILRIF